MAQKLWSKIQGGKRGNSCKENNFQLHPPAKQILGFSRFNNNEVGYQRSAICI